MQSKPHEILVVEDHADSAELLARVLRSMGHRVHTANTCADARQLFTSTPGIDVLMMDLGLPDGDGCELLQQLADARTVPAIAITGYGRPQDVERSKSAGFVAHITKPLDFPVLQEVLTGIQLRT